MASRRARRSRGPGPVSASRPGGELPDDFDPQLAELAALAPSGDDWLHEIKLDGYRMGCRIDHGAVRLLGRSGTDWGDKFPEVIRAAAALPVSTALLDGEVAVLDAAGKSHFADLQQLLAGGRRSGLAYFVFDVLHLDGEDLSRRPLLERKQRVHDLLGSAPTAGPLRAVDHIVGNGPAVFAQASRMGLEGIVSKRAGDPYRSGRGPGWLKIKAASRQEMAVGGFTHPKGQRTGVGALLLGHYDATGTFRYAGKVGTGFTEPVALDLRRRLEPLKSERCPFVPQPERLISRDAVWVEPALVVEVRFSNWTPDGRLRHASFEGLRLDKPARDVRRE